MKIRIGMLAVSALALFLMAAWSVNAANAQAYLGYRVSGYTEDGQGWQGNGYGYWHFQAYSVGYQQGLNDAQAGLTYECSGHTQYYYNGYSQGFNTYENNSQQQTQDAEINVNGNGNYAGINQEQTSGNGVDSSGHPALRDDNNGNGNGYDSSIQPGQANPGCKIISLTIVK